MDDLLTIKETAALMKVTDRTIRRWIADGRLDASKIARTVRIRRNALEALVLPGPGKTQLATTAQICPQITGRKLPANRSRGLEN